MKVKAKDLQWGGDDINEFGYYPVEIGNETGRKNNYSLSKNDYESKATWFETTPDLKGYGGTTIAVDVPIDAKMDKVNDTQYMVYDNISPENIVFVDKPIFNNYRTSDIENLVDRFGKDKVLDVFDKSKNQYISRDELVNMINENSKETSTTDSQGRTLSKQQQNYFKNSENRNEKNELKTMYRGSPTEVNIFEKGGKGKRYTNFGAEYEAEVKGFFFTENEQYAKEFGDTTEYYLNTEKILRLNDNIEDLNKIFKPMLDEMLKNQDISQSQYDAIIENGTTYKRFIDENGVDWETIDEDAFNDSIKIMQDLGYDSIEVNEGNDEKSIMIFESNQAKRTDNLNPTDNPDIRYSKDTTGAWNNFIEKYFKNEGTGTAIKDMKKLPVKTYSMQDIDNVLNETTLSDELKQEFRNDLKGKTITKEIFNEYKDAIKQVEKDYENYNAERKPSWDDLGEVFEQPSEEVESPLQDRNIETIGKETKKNAYQYENPEVKPYFQEMAQMIGEDLAYASDPMNKRTKKGGGTVLQANTKAINDLHNKYGYSYEQIGIGLNNIIEDNGAENNAVSKKIEFYIDDALRNGYRNIQGQYIQPNQDYINTIQYSIEAENQKETPKMPRQAQMPTAEQTETVDENLQAIRDNSLLNKEKVGKSRKHYKTYSQTDTLSVKDRNQAKKLYRDEVYVPISNNKTLDNANKRIKNFDGGIDALYDDYNYRISTGDEMSLTDIATMERMIQLYSEQQDHKKVNELMQNVAILGTELGQKVQALSIIKRSTPEGQLRTLQRLVQRVNTRDNAGIELTDEQVERILATNNPKETEKVVTQIAEELGQSAYAKFGDRARAWRYLSMLGNARTHIRNIFGNVAMDLVQQVKNKVAGAEQDVASIFKPSLERTATLRLANKEQRKFAREDAKFMKGAIDSNGVIDVEKIFEQSKRTSKSKVLNAIENFNSDLLEAEDDMFLNIAYRQAMQGYMASNKLTAKDMQDAKTLNKARQYAIQQAKEATFHQFSSLARQLNAIEKLGDATGLITAGTVPFKKTPINIAKTGVAYSPLGVARAVGGTINDITSNRTKLNEQLKKGDLTQEEYKTEISNMVNSRIDQMAKGLTGTAIAMLGYALAKNGIISGADDDEEDEFDTKLGKQELSVRIGDNTYSLDWLAPTAIPLFVGANIANTVYNSEDESALNATLTALANIVSPMTEMSMLQGLASALSSYETDSANKLGDIITSAVTSYAGQYVPTALGQIAKTIDPTVRDTSSTKKGIEGKLDRFKNQQMAKIPGVSQMLPSKSNVWGEEKTRADNPILRFLETAVLPYNREKVIEDMTSDELKNVFETSGEKSALPQNPQKYVTINKEKYNLTSKEYNQAKKTYGENSKKLLDAMFNNSEYKKLNDEGKFDMIKKVYAYSKEKIKSDYAKEHGLKFESNSTDGKDIFNSIEAVEKAGGKAEDYIKYMVGSQKYNNKADRLKYLDSLNLKESVKNAIYKNDIATYTFVSSGEDEHYKALETITGKVSGDYRDYVQMSAENKFNGQDENGETVKGLKQKRFEEFMNTHQLSPMEKIYISVKEGYAKNLSQDERDTLRKALNNNRYSIDEETYNSFIKKLDQAEKKKK